MEFGALYSEEGRPALPIRRMIQVCGVSLHPIDEHFLSCRNSYAPSNSPPGRGRVASY